jgi:6-phosphogluconolactonase
MYSELARHSLDWSRVQVTLADERWVPTDHADSNEGLVRALLLHEGASRARFIGLKNEAATPAAGAAAAWGGLGAIARPFDAVVLGMGDDGHVASLFPGPAQAAAGLDDHSAPACLAVQPAAAAHPRLSLNLAALLQSRRIFIQIMGERKRQTLERARGAGPVADMPIRAILRQSAVPVELYWCPDAVAESAP